VPRFVVSFAEGYSRGSQALGERRGAAEGTAIVVWQLETAVRIYDVSDEDVLAPVACGTAEAVTAVPGVEWVGARVGIDAAGAVGATRETGLTTHVAACDREPRRAAYLAVDGVAGLAWLTAEAGVAVDGIARRARGRAAVPVRSAVAAGRATHVLARDREPRRAAETRTHRVAGLAGLTAETRVAVHGKPDRARRSAVGPVRAARAAGRATRVLAGNGEVGGTAE